MHSISPLDTSSCIHNIHYCVFYIAIRAGLGALLPTVGLYVRAKGIGADEAALLGFLAPAIGFFARAAVPILADRIGFHKFVRNQFGKNS